MKKFYFSLDKVLDYKNQVEQNLRTEHAAAIKAVMQKEEEIKNLEETRRKYVNDLERAKARGCKIQEIVLYEGYISTTNVMIEKHKEMLEVLRKQEELKREEVIEAKKETSSIDMLKDKKKKEYDFLVRKNEEQFIEEFVTNSRMQAK